MDHYSIEQPRVDVTLENDARYVIFKNLRDIAYCKTWSEAVKTLEIIKLTDKVFSDVLMASHVGYEL